MADAIAKWMANPTAIERTARHMYRSADVDKSGYLEQSEVAGLVKRLYTNTGLAEPSEASLVEAWGKMDRNHDNKVTMGEWHTFLCTFVKEDKALSQRAGVTEIQMAPDDGAATVFVEAGSIRKGGFIVIKGRPCKISEVPVLSKTGRNGKAKCHYVAEDIFTGKKVEDMCLATTQVQVPFVEKLQLRCLGLEDGYLKLEDEEKKRDDVKMPEAANLAKVIQEKIENEDNFYVIVQCACHIRMAVDTKDIL